MKKIFFQDSVKNVFSRWSLPSHLHRSGSVSAPQIPRFNPYSLRKEFNICWVYATYFYVNYLIKCGSYFMSVVQVMKPGLRGVN